MVKGTKTDPLKYVHFAKVTVRYGSVPIDMLRYDRCMPNTERDSNAMSEITETRKKGASFIVRSYSESPTPHWTIARWASFSADLLPLNESELGAEYRWMENEAKKAEVSA